MGCGNSRQIDEQDSPVELKLNTTKGGGSDASPNATQISLTPSPTPQLLVFKGIKVGLQLLCKDEFVSKFTGEKMSRWRKSEVRTVENVDNGRVLIHYVGWSENFDFWLDLHSEWNKAAPVDLLSKNQCDQGLPLNDEQERITHNFLVTGKLTKKNLPPLNRTNSNSTNQSANSNPTPAVTIQFDHGVGLQGQALAKATGQLNKVESSSNGNSNGHQLEPEPEQHIPQEAMVPHYYVGQLVSVVVLVPCCQISPFATQIDVQDIFFKKTSETPLYKWRKATVIKVMSDKATIRVHYVGWDAKFDETLHLVKDAHRISGYDTMSATLELSKMQHILPQFVTYATDNTVLYSEDSSQKMGMQQTNSRSAMTIDSSDKKNVSSSKKNSRGKYLSWLSLSGKKNAAGESASSVEVQEAQPVEASGEAAQVAVVEGEVEEEFDEHFAAREKLYVEMMEKRGLHVIEIEGDGNCLFRAVSHQLFLTEDKHEELRALCVKHLVKHKERFEMFCSTNFDEHIAEMSVPGTWGDDLEIRALEEITDRLMSIHCSDIEEDFYERHIRKASAATTAVTAQTPQTSTTTQSSDSNAIGIGNGSSNSSSNPGSNLAAAQAATAVVSAEVLPTIDDFSEKEIDMITAPIHKNFEEDSLLKGVEPISLSYHGQNHYNSVHNLAITLPLEVRTSRVLMKARMELFHCASPSVSHRHSAATSSPTSPSNVIPAMPRSPPTITPVRLDATLRAHSNHHSGNHHSNHSSNQYSNGHLFHPQHSSQQHNQLNQHNQHSAAAYQPQHPPHHPHHSVQHHNVQLKQHGHQQPQHAQHPHVVHGSQHIHQHHGQHVNRNGYGSHPSSQLQTGSHGSGSYLDDETAPRQHDKSRST